METKKIILLVIIAIVWAKTYTQEINIGSWFDDSKGLPSFEYTGSLPYSATLANGDKVKLPSDPWFLLGNYRLTLFTHVSGAYELISGEREWGRLNQGNLPNSGSNSASLTVIGNSNKKYQLTGMNSLAADPKKCNRTFGVGYANYKYGFDKLELSRNISVKPSTNPYDGISAFLLTVSIKNNKNEPIEVIYNESVTVNYTSIQHQKEKISDRKIKFTNSINEYPKSGIIVANITGRADDPLLIPSDPEEMSEFDGYPPSLFFKIIEGKVTGNLSSKKNTISDELNAQFKIKLASNEERTFQMIIGYTFDSTLEGINKIAKELYSKDRHTNKFSDEWLKILPQFPDEKDEVFKREMVWNAYNLEAMATYSQFYKETKIPQGTAYDYDWGVHASARDNYQHALPLPHYNPKLAKSVLKYMMKRTTPQGRVRLIEWGFGYSSSWYFFTSDQQLFSFMYMAEYLRATKDYSVLNEKSAFFPYKNMPESSILDYVEAQFKFLRDQVNTGEHGLVRLLNSDWNDAIFHLVKEPYNNVLYSGESHMNSAMAISILDDLIPQLEKAKDQPSLSNIAKRLDLLIQSMQLYRNSINDSFIKDLGNSVFPKRFYFNGEAYGEKNMFLEPQGYTLQINDLSLERKINLYKEMQKRVYNNEKIAAREQQTPEFESSDFEKGSRENGGIWWALNGPVILGVAQFDKQEAWKLLKKMTFDSFAKEFPEYWSSYWSQADNFESSLMPGEGLPDQTANYGDMPVYCAHAHAWPLYCYFRLTE